MGRSLDDDQYYVTYLSIFIRNILNVVNYIKGRSPDPQCIQDICNFLNQHLDHKTKKNIGVYIDKDIEKTW